MYLTKPNIFIPAVESLTLTSLHIFKEITPNTPIQRMSFDSIKNIKVCVSISCSAVCRPSGSENESGQSGSAACSHLLNNRT